MARKLTRRAKKALNRKKFREARRRAASKSSRSSSRKKGKRKSKRRLSKKEWLARRIQTGRDYVAYKASRSASYGPVPFELQPSWLRAKQSKSFRAKRARWAKARSAR